jgi:tripartite-type tricarboxylate transporter receptor subunit TctC
VPTLKELGYNIHVGGGRGLALPAGVSREALAVMEAAAERAHKSAQWRDYATKNMYENTYMGSAALSQYLAKQLPAVGEFMESIGSKKTP